jgi:UDP-N-acetylmuramoylalanine--D-glutamate ligase
MLLALKPTISQMIDLAGKKVTVIGLGRFGGGIAVSKWLAQQGAQVLVTDEASEEALAQSKDQLKNLPITFHLGGHREEDFTDADLVVASPAVPPKSRYLELARQRNIPITTEIRLFIERCPAPITGVTGTKGKSTTTALLGEMLRQKYTTHVGGNIGRSLLFDLPNIQPDHQVVLEISSFMLEYLQETNWSPHVAVVTMIAPDHLDRHGSLDHYIAAKRTLVEHQQSTDFAILNEECPQCMIFARATNAKVIVFGRRNRKPFTLRIPGEHNQLNAQAAFAAASALNVSWDEAQRAIASFYGLPHRLQLVHEHRGVRYYNDSIATIPEAAAAALSAFPSKTVIQIVGGYDKGLSLNPLHAALVERAKAVLCIGATGPSIAKAMGQAAHVSAPAVYDCHDLATALKIARTIATPGDTILLSPGCASYDQFKNFEDRGETFANLARASI